MRKIVIPPSDPVGEIRELAEQRQAGKLTDEEYQDAFQEVNARHGETCVGCKRGIAVYIHTDGRHLCGDCALPLVAP